ncbi:hypothetical protein ACFQL1_05665 [Halomicroarcula sp. GCM10025709]|uniref:hypothetical protein n=1 Tax=Haloarcula TaxID=2237 RepID=UPI0024C22C6D|nr:hypothetical protein [Halomicroarcula sp. YJ-61-S]
MPDETPTYECGRCREPFPGTANHTELVRRDFVDRPRPSQIDRLCPECWAAYVGEFLGRDFDAVVAEYEQ